MEPTEFGKIYPHWGLKHLLYPNEVYQGLKNVSIARNNRKQDELRPVDPQRFVSTAERLLDGQSPHEWAVGLLALTGRRFSEGIAKGEFKPTTHPYAIAFRGQLKKGIQNPEDAQTFVIATLSKADKVLRAIERLRAHPRVQELAGLTPDEINSRSNTTVRHTIKREFEDTGIIPVLEGEKSVSAHNLRGCYAEIAIHFFCPPNQGAHRFIQAHLGHVIGEQEMDCRKNAGATEHYFHYRLTDSAGTQLSQKGILLEQVNRLPIAIDDGIPQPERAEPQPERAERERLEDKPMATTRTKPTQKQPSRSCVATPLMQQLKRAAASRLKIPKTATTAEFFVRVIAYLEEEPPTQDQNNPTEPKITSDFDLNALAPTFQWFTTEIERLRQEKEALERELEQVRSSVQTKNLEVERLRAEAEQFQQVRQMLGSISGVSGVGGAVAMTTPTAFRSVPQAAPTPRRSTEPAPRRQSREDAGEKGKGKIDEAIDLITSWNDNPAVEHNQKWFISVPVLLQLIRGSGYSVSQGRVQEALKARGEEIQQHHAAHGLSQRHNARHTKRITDDITLT
ncbi:MAG: hypothetical protein D6694_09250 [Gammaproteobacteria bacterium]|nr:MAG: hypothetical protein D6694_09250 [Gammaproteobacteria bacterium]